MRQTGRNDNNNSNHDNNKKYAEYKDLQNPLEICQMTYGFSDNM